jgi:hypothetical protein
MALENVSELKYRFSQSEYAKKESPLYLLAIEIMKNL